MDTSLYSNDAVDSDIMSPIGKSIAKQQKTKRTRTYLKDDENNRSEYGRYRMCHKSMCVKKIYSSKNEEKGTIYRL